MANVRCPLRNDRTPSLARQASIDGRKTIDDGSTCNGSLTRKRGGTRVKWPTYDALYITIALPRLRIRLRLMAAKPLALAPRAMEA